MTVAIHRGPKHEDCMQASCVASGKKIVGLVAEV